MDANTTDPTSAPEEGGLDATAILMAIVIFLMMLGMGAAVKWEDAKPQLTRPFPVLVGFASQYGFMPLITYGLGVFLVGSGGGFTANMAYGLLLTGCMPGGTTSNLFCYFSKGDIGLSLIMTVASTLFAFVMVPLMLSIYGPTFSNAETEMDNGTIIQTLLLVLIPASYGMYQRNRGPEGKAQADLLENIASKVGVLFIIAAVFIGLQENMHLLSSSWQVWAASLLPIPIGMFFGFAAGSLLLGCVSEKGKLIPNLKTIMLETGVQNSTLAVSIITLSIPAGADRTEMLTVPLLYSLGLVVEGAVATLLMRTMWINDVPESSAEVNLAEVS